MKKFYRHGDLLIQEIDLLPTNLAQQKDTVLAEGAEKNGYANIKYKGKTIKVHRFMYESHNGKIPEGLVIDHLCRNRIG